MFCRSFLLSTFIIFAVIFVSNLNATKCNNFQIDHSQNVITEEPSEKCVGCTGYLCKIDDGKILIGSACTETVKEICQQKWDDSMIQKIAKNDGHKGVNGKYFVHSCLGDYCNTLHWLLDYSYYRDFEIVCKANDKVVPCDQWEKKCFLNDKEVACNENQICYFNYVQYPCNGNDKFICKLNGKEISCDGTSKTCYLNGRYVLCDDPEKKMLPVSKNRKRMMKKLRSNMARVLL